ncbi:WD40-repeat-containing domain protein [Myxozyma melibiosi]|uniref:WD40-repeat-containing domain protein n=1 Tax=Myxozyma melibiosi TaxID=54550 RepID=A0ABR1F3B0_9ASCO
MATHTTTAFLYAIQPAYYDVISEVSRGATQKDQFWVWITTTADGGTKYGSVDVYRVGGTVELRGIDGFEVLEYNDKMIRIACNELGVKSIEFRNPTSTITTKSTISGFDISPSSNLYAVGSSSGTIALSTQSPPQNGTGPTATSEELTRTLEGHFAYTTCVKFFPSGKVLLSCGGDMLIKLWNIADGECARTFVGHKAAVVDLAMVGRGRNFLSASADRTVKLWECASGECAHTFEHPTAATAPTKVTVTTRQDGIVRAAENALEFETEDKMAVVGFDNGDVVLYGMSTKDVLAVVGAPAAEAGVVGLDLSEDGTELVVGRAHSVERWDLQGDLAGPAQRVETAGEVVGLAVIGDGVALAMREGGSMVVSREGAVEWVAAASAVAESQAEGVAVRGHRGVFVAQRDGQLLRYRG